MKTRKDIEALRIICVFGIVWFHAGAIGHQVVYEIAYAGLIAFLILSIYLAGGPPVTLAASLRKRFMRLLVPWMIWCAIYGVTKLALGRPAFDFDNGLAAGLLIGTSLHLWYLPFIFLALLAVDLLRSRFAASPLALSSAVLAIALFLLVPWWRSFSMDLGYPWAQYFHAAPGVLLGLFFLNYEALPAGTAKALTAALMLAALMQMPYVGVGTSYAVGIAAGYLIARRSGVHHTPSFLAAMGRYAFGVYLIHILAMQALTQQTVVQGAWLPVVAFATSLMLIAATSLAFPRTSKLIC